MIGPDNSSVGIENLQTRWGCREDDDDGAGMTV